MDNMGMVGPSTAAGSACSDMREINDAKVANILAYLDDALTTSPDFTEDTIGCSALHLTDSALRQADSLASLPSSINPNKTAATSCGASTAAWLNTAVVGLEGAQATYVGIKKRIEALRFDNEVLQQDNDDLRNQLNELRQSESTRKTQMRALIQTEMDDLKAQLDAQRKQSNEQLRKFSAERDELRGSVDALTCQLRQEMAHREDERAAMERAHSTAITTLKSKWQAQEKAAREKWRVAEAKRIKESTLQSLEPDIVLLLNRHKAEKARLKEDFETELRHRDELLAAKDAAVEEVKARLQRESESVLSREQQNYHDTLHREMELVQRQLEDERRAEQTRRSQMERFYEDQRINMQREMDRLGGELLSIKGQRSTEQAAFHERVSAEVARVTERSNDILEGLKSKLLGEFAVREKESAEENQKYLRARETELQKKVEIERDAAIAKVIHDLEEEHMRAMASARGTDSVFRERYFQMQRDNERLHVELDLAREQLAAALAAKQQKEDDLNSMRDLCDLSTRKIKAIEDRLRSEYDAKMTILDNEWKKKLTEVETAHVHALGNMQHQREALSIELAAARNQFECEQKQMDQKYHAELSHINERMLVALTRKDSTIKTQGEQLLALQEAIRVREVELHRHQLLLQQ